MPAEDAAAYRAAKDSAAVFDLTGWTVVTLSGRDCAKFLHNFCTNDIKGLKAGEGCEAFLTNVKARVVGHVGVFSSVYAGMGQLSLLSVPGQAERIISHLDRYLITEDVTIRDATAETALYYLAGPQAAERLGPLMMDRPAAAAPGRYSRGDAKISRTIDGALFDESWLFYRVDWLGLPGFLFWAPRERQAAAVEALSALGAAAGPEAFDSLRIEAAFPLYGTDVTEDHLAPEVGRPWAISYNKGCYLGQEPIARIDALGHVNRLLCGLRLDGGPAPERGAAVLAEGKEIGTVTSATLGLGDGKPVALAYLRAKFAEPGTTVAVRTSAGEIPATVYRAAAP